MPSHLQIATREDAPALLEVWNALYVHDNVDAQKFNRVIFDDPHVQPGSIIVAKGINRIQGFVSGNVIEGKGYLKALAFHQRQFDVAEMLLSHAESLVRSQNGQTVTIVHYPDDYYFFPGIDKRYNDLFQFFETHGYSEKEETHDMIIRLKGFSLTKRQKQKLEQVSLAGIRISEYENSMERALHDFRADIDQPNWFNELETGLSPGEGAIAARHGDTIVGLCGYQVRNNVGDFGPLHVRLEEREKGIGSALLLYAMLNMQKMGAEQSTAKWVWPFRLYESTGWNILRSYLILEKRL